MTCLITEEKNPDVFSPKDISGTRRGFKNQTRIKKKKINQESPHHIAATGVHVQLHHKLPLPKVFSLVDNGKDGLRPAGNMGGH